MKTLATALLLLASAAPLAAADAIPARPEQLTYKPLAWAPPAAKDHRVVLKKSGVACYLSENHDLPLVNVQILMRGGTYLNPPGKEGLAEFTGWLLARGGTKKRRADDLEERLAFLAAELNPEQAGGRPGGPRASGYFDDRGIFSLNVLSKDLDEGLAILREVLTEPAFQEDRLKLRKEQVVAELARRNDSSAGIEARERSVLLYGEGFHANRWETKASVESLTQADLFDFHKKWIAPRNMIVSAAGDFRKADMAAKLDALLSNWPFKGEAAPPVPKPVKSLDPGAFLVDKDVNQGRISILLPGIQRSDPDEPAAAVMNDILGGGGFTSRITNRVRSDEGLAYSARSSLVPGVWYPGRFDAAFQSKVRTAAYASQIVLEEMKGLRDAEVTDEELETAKRALVDTLPRRFATPVMVVNALADEEFTGRYAADPTYWATYQARIEKVTKADVQRVAKRLLKPESVTILAVGSKAGLLDPDPKHPVRLADLAGGKLVEVPLRDPLTMAPAPKGAAK